MALNYVTLTIDLSDGAGSHANGGIATFTPSVQLTDATDHEIITQAPVTAAFKPTGSPAVLLLATDNGNVAPSGSPHAVASSGSPWFNGYTRDAWLTLNATTITAVTITGQNGVTVTQNGLAGSPAAYALFLPSGGSYTATYTGTLTHTVTLI